MKKKFKKSGPKTFEKIEQPKKCGREENVYQPSEKTYQKKDSICSKTKYDGRIYRCLSAI